MGSAARDMTSSSDRSIIGADTRCKLTSNEIWEHGVIIKNIISQTFKGGNLMILGGVAGKDVFKILALTKWWTEWPIRILFANPLFESGPLLWHLAYPKLERCHPVHLWFCVFISISSFSAAAEAAGWAEQESWRTGSVALTWAPNTGSDLKSWLMLVFRSDYLHLSLSLHLTYIFRCFSQPDCLFFFGGGDRLNHRPQSCADGTWTWFAFTTGGIESAHSGGKMG